MARPEAQLWEAVRGLSRSQVIARNPRARGVEYLRVGPAAPIVLGDGEDWEKRGLRESAKVVLRLCAMARYLKAGGGGDLDGDVEHDVGDGIASALAFVGRGGDKVGEGDGTMDLEGMTACPCGIHLPAPPPSGVRACEVAKQRAEEVRSWITSYTGISVRNNFITSSDIVSNAVNTTSHATSPTSLTTGSCVAPSSPRRRRVRGREGR